ncbi:MAG: OmpA family protein [Bacteroidia bacterium]|nr:OmpA family protein [Bacteroidia bacterium]
MDKIYLKGFKLSALLYLLFIATIPLFSQEPSKHKLYTDALNLINEKRFKEALPKLLIVDSLEKGKSYMTRYNIGMCYLNSKYDKTKAIPYLEFAITKEKFLIDPIAYFNLGYLFHLNYQFDKAIKSFELFRDKIANLEPKYDIAGHMIEVCNNAKKYVPDSLSVEIINLGNPVNTNQSEYASLVSADESIIYFTRKRNPDISKPNEKADSLEHIYVSYLKDKKWSNPQEIKFDLSKNKNISLAGLAPDGEQLFLCIDNDLYFCRITEGKYSNLEKFKAPINTDYWEGKASMTADGRELYFSSDRPSGIGGKDIYLSELGENNEWGEPINLGNIINTLYDEDAPFIHPDKHTLYFSSKAHTTIGGYDIFQSFKAGESWTESRNMGYPINTVKDDLHFFLSANGKNGYFSSDKDNLYYCHDIYIIVLKKSIPLTMVKGIITAGNPPKPIAANIRVIDKQTGELVKYVYNPNPKTGKYLMIFPPGKNYEIIIEANDFLPRQINIYIPDQVYFYELFQDINLHGIQAMNKTVGEEIVVTNTFTDISKQTGDTTIQGLPNKDYGQLLDLIEDIIIATDTLNEKEIDQVNENLIIEPDANTKDISVNKDFDALFTMIEDAIETTDSTSLIKLDEETIKENQYKQSYYYAKDKKDNNLEAVIIGNDTIYSVPPLQTTQKASFNSFEITRETQKEEVNIDFSSIKENYKKIILEFDIIFDPGRAFIKEKYKKDIQDFIKIARENPRIAIDITSFCDLTGEAKNNNKNCMAIITERNLEVIKAFKGFGLEESKIITKKWDGTPQNTKEKNYSSNIKLYEVVDEPLYEVLLPSADVINFDVIDLKVEDIKAGQEIRLNNIFFAYKSYELTDESTTELDNVVKFLNENSTLKIEIGGHTDNKGSDETNQKLSKNRAQAVANFLIRKGIDKNRLVVKGYGEARPIAYNDTDEGCRQNRRVVFTILEK